DVPIIVYRGMVYDLTNKRHKQMFRMQMEFAADYLQARIDANADAKRRKALRGLWTGQGITPGYYVMESRYIQYEPWSEVVRAYFEMFEGLEYNIKETARRIRDNGPYYPEPVNLPEGCHFPRTNNLLRCEQGFYPSRASLRRLLTNAFVVGH